MSGLIARRATMQPQGENFPAGFTRVSGIRINNGAYAIHTPPNPSNIESGLKYIFTKSFSEISFNISAGGVYRPIHAKNDILAFGTGASAGSTYTLDGNIERHEITLDYLKDGNIICDGVKKDPYIGHNRFVGIGAYINSSGVPAAYAKNIIIHLVESSYKDTINFSFVPAIRDSDNVAGFVNTVKGDYYGLFLPSSSDVPFVAVI